MWTNHSTRTIQSVDRSSFNDSLDDVPSSMESKQRNGSAMTTPMSKANSSFVTPMKKQLRTPSTIASTPSSCCPSSEPSSAPTVTPYRFHENGTPSTNYSKDDVPTTSRTTVMRNEFQSSVYESEMDMDLSKSKRAFFRSNDASPQRLSSTLLAPPSPKGSGSSFRLKPQSRSNSVEKHESSSYSISASNTTRLRQKSVRREDSVNSNSLAIQDMAPPVNNYHIKPASSFETVTIDKVGYNSSKDRKIYNSSPVGNGSSHRMFAFSTPSKGINKRNKKSLKTSKIFPFLLIFFGMSLTGVAINLFIFHDNDESQDGYVVNDVKLQTTPHPSKDGPSKREWLRPQPIEPKKEPLVHPKNQKRVPKRMKFKRNNVDHETPDEETQVISPKKKKKSRSLPFQSFHTPSNEKHTHVDGFKMYGGKKSSSDGHPRLFNIEGSSHQEFESPQPRAIQEYPAEFSDNTQFYSVLPSDDTRLRKMEIREPLASKECVPMQEWQTTFNPSCNGMHELDLVRMEDKDQNGSLQLFGKKGFWRNAWRVDLLGENQRLQDRETVVLKTLRYFHNFEDAHFEHDRIDAVSMERLTASPHVINIYSFCGHSVISEYATGTKIGTLADKSKKKPLKRLEIARDIASGLADVHGIDGDGNATFVHLDINPANVVVVGNELKLNDFNIGILLKWNTTSNKQCGFPAQYPNPQWRSPEEANQSQFLTEKVDVFSMGHILFRLICGHEPWNKLEIGGKPKREEMNEKVKAGILPRVPDEVMNTDDEEVIAIRDAMFDCYTYDPEKRPSAREITRKLNKALLDLKYKMDVARKKKHTRGRIHVS